MTQINGIHKLTDVLNRYEVKLTAQEKILKDGFAVIDRRLGELVQEVKNTRDQGFIPLPIVEQLQAQTHNGYRIFIKTLAWAFGAVIGVLAGARYFLPNIFG